MYLRTRKALFVVTMAVETQVKGSVCGNARQRQRLWSRRQWERKAKAGSYGPRALRSWKASWSTWKFEYFHGVGSPGAD